MTLDVTAAIEGDPHEEGPEFVGSVTEKVAAGAATFKNPVVKWSKPLRQEGELVVVDATLSFGTGNSEFSDDGHVRRLGGFNSRRSDVFLFCWRLHESCPNVCRRTHVCNDAWVIGKRRLEPAHAV